MAGSAVRRLAVASRVPCAPPSLPQLRLESLVSTERDVLLQDRLEPSAEGQRWRASQRCRKGKPSRAARTACLATTPHPARLGSALTHPLVTTDFSESQLELITGVHPSPDACMNELTEIHQAVYRAIGDELLWAASMPCRLPADDAIPIGQYGTSNVGRTKSVYRMGLSYRYGRRMQTISGIHYNFSSAAATLQRRVLRPDPQFPPAVVAAAVPVRRLARPCARVSSRGERTSWNA